MAFIAGFECRDAMAQLSVLLRQMLLLRVT
jgi:hypothetical protein